AEVSLPHFEYSKPQQWTAFSDQLMARIQASPGLANSAVVLPPPVADDNVNLGFKIEGGPPLPPGVSSTADFAAISPNYFQVMEIPLLRGRFFDQRDSPSAPRVAVISEALAQFYFPNENPIGKHLIFGFPPDTDVTREIVGIVGDVRDVSLSQAPGPMMYVPFDQAPFWGVVVVTKSSLSSSSVAAAIRRELQNVDKDLPVTDVESMSDAIESSVAQPRYRMLFVSLFGVIALLLAAAGIFGVISYSVSCRTHEIGIRVALGATPASVLWLILSESARLVLLGLAIGIPVALGLARFLSNLLFAVRPADPLTFVGVALLLTLVGFVATYVPTRRAMRVDPMVALRHE
ncbi:MAG: FtsX-like permease family protein, partial [Candidatus Acidiferrales bacterium]